MIEVKLKEYITKALMELGITDASFALEHPADITHGDFATNVAMVAAKRAGKNPRALAEEIVAKLGLVSDPDIFKIDIAGPGFINVHLSDEYFKKALKDALAQGEDFGKNNAQSGKKVIVEYTDPNPFKEFHIGHLMSNTIGESISRIIEASGAETKRACYQGDVGLHVAKAIWGVLEDVKKTEKIREVVGGEPAEALHNWEDLLQTGKAYTMGNSAYEKDDAVKALIVEINKKLYD
jgi:arginyl-tRNA synthetase